MTVLYLSFVPDQEQICAIDCTDIYSFVQRPLFCPLVVRTRHDAAEKPVYRTEDRSLKKKKNLQQNIDVSVY